MSASDNGYDPEYRVPSATLASPFSLDPEMIQQILDHARPLGHGEVPADLNLGFGFVYYGLVRALRPEHVVVIGSGYGFSVVCLALGLKDNRAGRLSFVDPSYSLLANGPADHRRRELLAQSRAGAKPLRPLRRRGRRHPLQIHQRGFFGRYEEFRLPTIDMAFIDGNHSYAHVQGDVAATLQRSRKNAYLLLHDTNIYIREFLRHAGVKRWLRSKANRHKAAFEYVDFPFASGVAVLRVMEPKVWKELS